MASNIITSDGKDLDERYLPKGTSIPPHSKAHLVDSWRSGANWWRKWSDGFIEQGGVINNPRIYANENVRLHHAMASSDYVVQVQMETDLEAAVRATSRATASFVFSCFRTAGSGSAIRHIHWYVCGF